MMNVRSEEVTIINPQEKDEVLIKNLRLITLKKTSEKITIK